MTHAVCAFCGGTSCTCFATDEEYLMPGPVSDSYDPEFGTGRNAAIVAEGVRAVGQRVTDVIGSGTLKNIVEVAGGNPGPSFTATLSEREWRLLRFAVNRALESL
jgi:hypothetical protein